MIKKSISLFGATLLASTTLMGAGGVFADSIVPSPNNGTTDISANLTIDYSQVPELPSGTNDQTHNNEQNTQAFGMAYCPKSLSGQGTLNSSGQQVISLSNNAVTDGYHVGVKDITRSKHQWNLTAKLDWNGLNKDYMKGSTVKLSNGVVNLNNQGTLQTVDNGEVTGETSVTINTSPSNVMTGVADKTKNGVYNYKFTNAELIIPSVQVVPEGTYGGTITWNLSEVPGL